MEKIWQIIKYSAKCNIWVLLALALIQPFGIDQLEEGRISFILAETFLCFITVCIAESIGIFIVRCMKNECTTVKAFLLHLIITNLIHIPLLGAVLLSFNSWYKTGSVFSYWFWGDTFTLRPLCEMSMYVAALSLFLIVGQYLHFKNSTLQHELNEIKAINKMLEQRQERFEQDESEAMPEIEETDQDEISITGQGQDSNLITSDSKIIYVESMANYADICYISNNEICHRTLRITLKQVREELEHVGYIVQCHRAFLVNINFVVSMENAKSAYQLQLFGMDKRVPVSRANVDLIRNALKK